MPLRNEILFLVNPGSTSTKLAVFEGDREIRRERIVHADRPGAPVCGIWNQFGARLEEIRRWFSQSMEDPGAVVAMGGLFKPLESGTYAVSPEMLKDARKNLQGEHASNLGCALASEIARKYKCPAYVVDPVSVDEFEAPARYSGHPLIGRRSLSHALNIHAAARHAAGERGKKLNETSFIVAHLGGGISIAPVRNGRIVDANDASSDGPFSPERTGGLPLQQFISLFFSGNYTEEELRSLVMGKGGLFAYLDTKSADEVERRIGNGDQRAAEVFDAMAYQIAKEIGAMATVLKGSVEAIVLTGGLASSKVLVDAITERVKFLAPVTVFPGEHEMEALAQGALRVLRGEEQPKVY